MIRFVDLGTGHVFNGDLPYIHWFEDQQSTKLIYVKKICVVTDQPKILVKLHCDKIFHLLDLQHNDLKEDQTINDFTYKNLQDLYVTTYASDGYKYPHTYDNIYLHMIYVAGSSDCEGEFLEYLYINDQKYQIGSSFYDEYEPHRINLANFGYEIPESIQRAIYTTNVHEEMNDYATLNRKWKELLLEYWSIIAQRGNYNSLYDALAWFEYGDLITIREFWKHHEWTMDRLNHQPLNSILDQEIKNSLSNYAKTTYIGLYLALQKFGYVDGQVEYETNNLIRRIKTDGEDASLFSARLDRKLKDNGNDDGSVNQHLQIGNKSVNVELYDDPTYLTADIPIGSNWKRYDYSDYEGILGEAVPALKAASIAWSRDDLSLKMYLLGNYYERYFMPIHLDLLHSTVEDLVFANTIKIPTTEHVGRWDWCNNTQDFLCSVKNGDVFRLDDLHVQVGPDTLFSTHYEDGDYDDVDSFGVQDTVDKIMDDSDDEDSQGNLRTFMSQWFDGVGVMIPFDISLPLDEGDFVNRESVTVICDKHNIWEHQEFNKLLHSDFTFNLLCTMDKEYQVTLQFNTAGGRTFVKTITFDVIDTQGHSITLYKVKSGAGSVSANDYMFGHHRRLLNDYPEGRYDISDMYYQQFIPAVKDSVNGVKLNHILVYEGDVNYADDTDPGLIPMQRLQLLREKYQLVYRYRLDESGEETDEVTYTIAISNDYWFTPNEDDHERILPLDDEPIKLIRNDYVYFPGSHHLEEVTGDSLESFTVTDEDAISIVPDVEYSKIVEPEWIFINDSTGDQIKLSTIKEPFIANTKKKLNSKSFLTPGYYTIKFRYRLSGDVNNVQEIQLNSCFRKV